MKLEKLTVMLETDDLDTTIQFYKEKLGFSLLGSYPKDKKPSWAHLALDNVAIMFTLRDTKAENVKKPFPGVLYIYPDNVDEVWEKLKDTVKIEWPIKNFDHGMREFAIRDCNNYILSFGQQIK